LAPRTHPRIALDFSLLAAIQKFSASGERAAPPQPTPSASGRARRRCREARWC